MSKKSSIRVRVGDALISGPLSRNYRPWFGIGITDSGPCHTRWLSLGTFETWEEASLKAQSPGLNPIVVDFDVDYGILKESGRIVEFRPSFGSEEDR